MPKNFFNKYKKVGNRVFEPVLFENSHLRNIGKNIPEVNPFNQSKGKRRKEGNTIRNIGSAVSAVGALTGQPELGALGVGLSATGDIVKGGSKESVLRNVAIDVAGGVAGSFGEDPLSKTLLSSVGSKIASDLIPDPDRTHRKQLKDQVKENQHFDDKEQHHNSVQLPSDLQGTGQVKSNVGSNLLARPTDIVKTPQQFENDINSFNNGIQILEFLVGNFNNFEHLNEENKSAILQDALESGLLTNLLDNLGDF